MCFTKTFPNKHELEYFIANPLIVREDVICFKVLQLHNGQLISPFYGFDPWIPNQIKTSIFTWNIMPMSYAGGWRLDIEAGLHSFVRRESSIAMVNSLERIEGDHSHHKFIIPKGSLYYKDGEEYVSNQLIFIE